MIDVNPTLGFYCDQRRLDWYVRIAGELDARVPNIASIKVWYNGDTDFVIIEFDLDAHHYYIEGYKLYTVQKDDCRHDKAYFRQDHELIDFFCGNYFHGPNSCLPAKPKYKTWNPKPPCT